MSSISVNYTNKVLISLTTTRGRRFESDYQLQNLRKHGVFAGFFFFRKEFQNSIRNKKSHSFLRSEILFVYPISRPRPSIDHL